jgi:hypothetical protein
MHLVALAASWMLMLSPFSAAASGTPALSITGSGATTIGLQIFANSNLTGGSAPTGTISFRLYGPGDTGCSSAIFTSTVPVAGTSMNSAHYTTAAAGTYRWTSTYNGDANNNPVGPTSCSDPNAPVIVQGANTGLSVTAPAPTGGTIHAAAVLGGGFNPGGSLSFFLSPPGDTFCSETIFTSTVAVAGNGTYASANYVPTVTGTYRWRASYSGDTNNKPAPITACLDQNDAVDVTSVSQPAPAAAALSPTSLSFAAQTVGTASAAQTVTVTNTGGTAFAISAAGRGGTDPGDFATSNDHCTGATIAPAATCTIAATFTPAAAGTRTATLTFTDNAPGSPHTLALTGEGSAPAVGATLTYPLDGQTAVDTTRSFTWAPIAAAQGYILAVGTTQYGTDLVNSGILPASQTAFNVPALPTGRTLYAALLTKTNGGWTLFQAITFTAAPGFATLTYPVDGQNAVDTTRSFTWAPIAPAQGYILAVGTTQYGTDLVNSGILPASQTAFNVPALPTGRTLYAALLTKTNGGWTRFQAITFTAAPGLATFTNPLNGQTNIARSPVLSWSTIAQGQGYVVGVGTTRYGSDVVNSGVLPATQSSLSGVSLPAGKTLYATLFTKTNGGWTRYQDITFTTA